MSYFLITSKNTLPEQFREGIDITDKQAIAEKLIVESFLTQLNFLEAVENYSSVYINHFFRLVEDYTVTNMSIVNSEEDATRLVNIFITTRDKNANQIGRSWTHPEDPNQYVVTALSDEELVTLLVESYEQHVTIDVGNLQFY